MYIYTYIHIYIYIRSKFSSHISTLAKASLAFLGSLLDKTRWNQQPVCPWKSMVGTCISYWNSSLFRDFHRLSLGFMGLFPTSRSRKSHLNQPWNLQGVFSCEFHGFQPFPHDFTCDFFELLGRSWDKHPQMEEFAFWSWRSFHFDCWIEIHDFSSEITKDPWIVKGKLSEVSCFFSIQLQPWTLMAKWWSVTLEKANQSFDFLLVSSPLMLMFWHVVFKQEFGWISRFPHCKLQPSWINAHFFPPKKFAMPPSKCYCKPLSGLFTFPERPHQNRPVL